MNEELPFNDLAEDILNLILLRGPNKENDPQKGSEFTSYAIQTLTLCLSEIIKAGYCDTHYDIALILINEIIKQDLNYDK